MSRISDWFLNSVLYLYPTERAAMQGAAEGGTGFLYGVRLPDNPQQCKVFAVTCRHVLGKDGVSLRINTLDKGFQVLKTARKEWLIHPAEDLAIFSLPYDAGFNVGFVVRDTDTLSQDLITRLNIGPGDDAFVIGRFAQHGGKEQNTPVVRFGNLAMMPLEPVYNPEIDLETTCYLVDLRTREGFSGSPVFIQYHNRVSVIGNKESGPWSGEKLLGLSWGAFKTTHKVKDIESNTLLSDYGVEVHEGMACVIPAERIDNLLDQWAG